MKRHFENKGVKILLVVFCLFVAFAICGFAVQNGLKQKKTQEHLALAAKYLDELDYEQALTEYAAVLKIEPKNQCALNSLETIYLEYAQIMEKNGELEEAELFLEQGYYQFEIDILQERAAELKKKMEKEQEQEQKQTSIVQRELPNLPETTVTQETKETESKSEIPPLSAAMTPNMFGIAGHSIDEENFEVLCEDIGITLTDDPNGTYEKRGSIEGDFPGFAQMTNGDGSISLFLPEADKSNNIYYYKYDGEFTLDLLTTLADIDVFLQMVDTYQISAPIMVGDNYEDWCQLIEKEKLEAKGDIQIDLLGRKTCRYQNKGAGLSIIYMEEEGEDFDEFISKYCRCEYRVETPGHTLNVTIDFEMENGTIFSLTANYD